MIRVRAADVGDAGYVAMNMRAALIDAIADAARRANLSADEALRTVAVPIDQLARAMWRSCAIGDVDGWARLSPEARDPHGRRVVQALIDQQVRP